MAAGEQNSSFLLACGAVLVELLCRGNSKPRTTVPLGFSLISAVVTTQECKERVSDILVTLLPAGNAEEPLSWPGTAGLSQLLLGIFHLEQTPPHTLGSPSSSFLCQTDALWSPCVAALCTEMFPGPVF